MKKYVKKIILLITVLLFCLVGYIGYCYLTKKPVPFFGRKIRGQACGSDRVDG